MRKDCSTCKHDYDDDCYPVKPPCDNCVHCSHSAPTNWEPADYYKPDTNADRIRAMTDEELAEWILDGVSCDPCDYCKHSSVHCISYKCKSDEETILDWLRQPVKED